MAGKYQLVDHRGQPLQRARLTQEIAAPTLGGVRSPISNYPADGLNPVKLANILREADAGDPVRYLELAEIIEERDPHYLGVISTRKRSVSQVEISVKAASEDPADLKIAKMVEDWLDRDELANEVFDILDAIGKGYSFTEIVWDFSEGQCIPEKLIGRDPRSFRFARHDLTTPLMLDDTGAEVPLEAFRFIYAQMGAKSGLPLRSGLARVAAWGWMFKAFTQRDWAIFTQTFGQPLRLGKFGPGASEQDRDTLFRAVANIAGDCAAIIPESMSIDFVETGNFGSSVKHYEERSDWLDKQISKAVLGQTSTTDAETGGLGSGKEHREVQEVIERADCLALQAILNRDLIMPWVQLEYGPQKRYPRLRIARPEEEDLAHFSEAISPLIDRGLRVSTSSIYEKFGLSEPAKKEETLRPMMKSAPNTPVSGEDGGENPGESAVKHPLNTREANSRAEPQSEGSGALTARSSPVDIQAERLEQEAAPGLRSMLEQIEAMLEAARDLEEFREMLSAAYPDLDTSTLSSAIAQGLIAADLAGRAALEEESGG